MGDGGSLGLTLVARTSVTPESIAQAAVAAVHEIDPEQPVDTVQTMEAVLDGMMTSQRFSALLLGAFAAVALLLASVGIYSVLAYIVRGRSREIGIRTALGARTADVARMVVVEGLSPAVLGAIIGAAGALAAGRLLSGLVFGVSATIADARPRHGLAPGGRAAGDAGAGVSRVARRSGHGAAGVAIECQMANAECRTDQRPSTRSACALWRLTCAAAQSPT